MRLIARECVSQKQSIESSNDWPPNILNHKIRKIMEDHLTLFKNSTNITPYSSMISLSKNFNYNKQISLPRFLLYHPKKISLE
jgi:hypothetical protein